MNKEAEKKKTIYKFDEIEKIKECFRLRLKEGRCELKMTQIEFAEFTGISRNIIANWESNKKNAFPSLEHLFTLCNAFECEVGYLLGFQDTKFLEFQKLHSQFGFSENALSILKTENEKVNQQYSSTSFLICILEAIIFEYQEMLPLLNDYFLDVYSYYEIMCYPDDFEEMKKIYSESISDGDARIEIMRNLSLEEREYYDNEDIIQLVFEQKYFEEEIKLLNPSTEYDLISIKSHVHSKTKKLLKFIRQNHYLEAKEFALGQRLFQNVRDRLLYSNEFYQVY